MQMRANIRPKYGLSPFEILFGRPVNTDIGPIKRQLPITDKDLMNNCNILVIALKKCSFISKAILIFFSFLFYSFIATLQTPTTHTSTNENKGTLSLTHAYLLLISLSYSLVF